MLFSWLSKILASMLVAVLASAVVTTTLNQTVLSSHYVEGKLASTNSYQRLSTALTDQISKDAANTGNAAVATQIQSIITPTVLQQKINSALDQLQAYYRGNGPLPVIDLTDLAVQAQAAGIPIPADSGINKPIVLSSNEQARGLSKSFDQVRMGALITSLVLVAALLAVSWERHRWAALPDVLIVVGVLVGLLALAFSAVSGMAGHYVKFDTSSNAFAMIGRDLAAVIASDLARRLGIIAGLFLAVGIGTRIWVAKMAPKTLPKSAPKASLKSTVVQ